MVQPTITVSADGTAAEIHDIVPSISIAHLLQQRNAAIAKVTQALALLADAYTITSSAHLGFADFAVEKSFRGITTHVTGEFDRRDEAMQIVQAAIDAGGWRYLMSQSGMRSLMSASKRKEFDAQLHQDKVPELTDAAIRATFGALHDSRGEMFEQGVIECFKRLSWRYKTNLPVKFGKRIVITRVTSYSSPNHNTTNELDDLVRVFHVCDSIPEPDHRNGCYTLIANAMQAQPQYPKMAANDYFSIRIFKNGNGHATFKRPDLVDRLNRIIAKHFPDALPAPK